MGELARTHHAQGPFHLHDWAPVLNDADHHGLRELAWKVAFVVMLDDIVDAPPAHFHARGRCPQMVGPEEDAATSVAAGLPALQATHHGSVEVLEVEWSLVGTSLME